MQELFPAEKKRFQVDRLILFSDAVFAIAITLLIIEIKIPEMGGLPVDDQSFWQAFVPSIPKFIGFAMSFALIGLYWSKHHQLFGFVTGYTPKLIFLNLFLLFAIVLMPYTTAVYSEFSDDKYASLLLPYLFYVTNISLCGLANYLLWDYITKPASQVSSQVFRPRFVRNAKWRAMILPIVFILSFLVCWIFHSPLGRMILFLIPFCFLLIKGEKKK